MHVAPVDGAIARRQVFVGMPAVVVRMHVHHGMASHVDEASPPASEGGVTGVETHPRARRQPTKQPGEFVRMATNQGRQRGFDGQHEAEVRARGMHLDEARHAVGQPGFDVGLVAREIRRVHHEHASAKCVERCCGRHDGLDARSPVAKVSVGEIEGAPEGRVHRDGAHAPCHEAIDIQTKDGETVNALNLGVPTQLEETQLDSDVTIDQLLTGLKAALDEVRSQASTFGSNLSIVQNRKAFTEAMINTLETGAGNLTLADMNTEAANLLALQTRQQLSQNSLSLASQADQSILQLLQ